MCFAPQRRALFRHFFDIWTSKSGPRPSVFNTFDLEMWFAPQRRALFRHRNFQKWSENGVFCTFWLGNVLRATTACTFSTSQLPKVVRRWGVLYILTWKCASRHNGVHFFDISTSKSGPTLRCFVHFDLEMCFAPQRRALFRHLNFQKWSEPLVFCTFWLGNVLRATTACNFSSLLWPAGSAPAALASLLFDPPEPQIIGKTVFRDFPTFSRICIFCPLTLSLLIFSLLIFLVSVPLPCSAFHLSILSEVWLLNFLRIWYNMGLSQTGVPQKVCNKPTNPYYLVGIQHLVAMAPKQPRADDREFLATVNALEGVPTKRIQHKPIYWYVLDVFFL